MFCVFRGFKNEQMFVSFVWFVVKFLKLISLNEAPLPCHPPSLSVIVATEFPNPPSTKNWRFPVKQKKKKQTFVQLGQKTRYEQQYTPSVLEAFENAHSNDYFIRFNCPEFTAICPITSQPDFATIVILYIPDKLCVESKSLKLYLHSYRNHGEFHENCVNRIMKDLIALLHPKYIEVRGKFMPRGGLSIDPYANYGKGATYKAMAQYRLRNHDLA